VTPQEQIAYLRRVRPTNDTILAVCDLAERALLSDDCAVDLLSDDEAAAVRRYERNAYTAADAVVVRAVLRRLLGDA
jgi:hypothetical protein